MTLRAVIASFGATIRSFLQANCGTYAALNAAIAKTSGDWIAIQNSDDLWQPEKLERQAELIAAHPALGLVHTNFGCIDADDNLYPGRCPDMPDFHGPVVQDMHPVMLHSNPVVISSTLISRAAWERLGPFDVRYRGMGDWDLCLRISQEFLFGFVETPLTLYRKHTANSGTDVTRLPTDWNARDWQSLSREKMPGSARQLFARAQRGEIAREQAAFGLVCLATIYNWQQEPDLARFVYVLAARLQPLRWKTYARYATTFLPRALRGRIR